MELLKIGTRPSRLALEQAAEIKSYLPWLKLQIVPIKTSGDKDKFTPLVLQEESDFFTREIEEALLKGDIDVAVHSAKDLEQNMPQGLIVAAITRSISPFECLVSRDNLLLHELPKGSRVATSSQRRRDALAHYRKDFILEDIRGNVDERLAQLDSGAFDALIVAHAAMLRLGYEDRIAQIIPADIMPPHPLQGRLALQVKSSRADLFAIFRSLHEK